MVNTYGGATPFFEYGSAAVSDVAGRAYGPNRACFKRGPAVNGGCDGD
jgi:hypothetical protein